MAAPPMAFFGPPLCGDTRAGSGRRPIGRGSALRTRRRWRRPHWAPCWWRTAPRPPRSFRRASAGAARGGSSGRPCPGPSSRGAGWQRVPTSSILARGGGGGGGECIRPRLQVSRRRPCRPSGPDPPCAPAPRCRPCEAPRHQHCRSTVPTLPTLARIGVGSRVYFPECDAAPEGGTVGQPSAYRGRCRLWGVAGRGGRGVSWRAPPVAARGGDPSRPWGRCPPHGTRAPTSARLPLRSRGVHLFRCGGAARRRRTAARAAAPLRAELHSLPRPSLASGVETKFVSGPVHMAAQWHEDTSTRDQPIHSRGVSQGICSSLRGTSNEEVPVRGAS